MTQHTVLFIANYNIGSGLSGGDKIAINLIKHWSKKYNLVILGSADAKSLFNRYSILTSNFIQTDNPTKNQILSTPELFIHYLKRLFLGSIAVIKNVILIKKADYIYTCSDFFPDLLIGFLAKLLNPQAKWIAGYYLFAPSPFRSNSNYNQNKQYVRGFVYYLSQIISLQIVKNLASHVFVTSLPDVAKFINFRLDQSKIHVIQGGVDSIDYQKYKKSKQFKFPINRTYDAVYLGRLHTQKGVNELIDIWKIVTSSIPQAKLIIIGNGDQQEKVAQSIIDKHLTDNVTMAGFLEGPQKVKIFQNSKLVVHPAIYDSGGMAAAEAMSWGLPGVSFDLDALKTYYPYGMLKSKLYDLNDFAENIIKLLTNAKLYNQISNDALRLIRNNWNWEKRLKIIDQQIFEKQK